MAEFSWQPVMGAAQRRRQRRLRSWWRHEKQSIAAALAAATHHSAQQNGAPRGQRTATRAREEAGSETHYAPREPKTLPPGTRPAPPAEVAGPLGPSATVGDVAAGAPLLAVSSVRGADGVDDTAVKFLLRAELLKEEEKERKAEEEKHERRMLALNHRVGEGLPLTGAEWSAWRKWATSSSSSAGKRKKRKKRRKRKLPKAGCRLFPPCCGRPCDHASDSVHPQTLGIPVAAQRQVPTVHAFQLQVQFLDMALDMPVVVRRQVPGSMVQKTGVVPQLHFIDCRRHPFSYRSGRSPWSRLLSRPQRFSSCPSFSGGRCSCSAGRACHARCCQRQVRKVQSPQKTAATSSRQSRRSLRLVHRRDVQVLRRGDLAAFCGIFRTPSAWT